MKFIWYFLNWSTDIIIIIEYIWLVEMDYNEFNKKEINK